MPQHACVHAHTYTPIYNKLKNTYSATFENLKQISEFLYIHGLPQSNQDERNNLKNEVEATVKQSKQ